MKKIILVYGIVSGVIVIGSAILSVNLMSGSTHLAGLEWLGYLIMLIALSVIFIGIKRYRDNESGGVIRFWKALQVGLGISVVAGLVYVVAWEANLAATDYRFIDEYNASVIQEVREAPDATPEKIEEAIASAAVMKERYDNPGFRLPMTFLEIFPVGFLISLISAAVLRNPGVMPARVT